MGLAILQGYSQAQAQREGVTDPVDVDAVSRAHLTDS